MFSEKALKLVNDVEDECSNIFEKLEDICLYNQKKVLDAFRDANVCLTDIASSTGYGEDDRSKGKLAEVYAKTFGGETAIVSPLLASGTHTLTVALFGILRPGDTMLSVTGKPYDTLINVIFGEGNGSLRDFKINYQDVELKNNDFDMESIIAKVKELKPKMVYVQRSRGYTSRESLSIEKIERLVKEVRNIDKSVIIMVDNCYGEFVEKREPCDVGVDIMAGSLIKNAGGGIAPTGGYIVGTKKVIEMVSSRFIAPGIGLHLGSYAGSYTPFFQGLFSAPHVTLGAMKGNILFGRVAENFGIKSSPKFGDMPHDIVRSIEFGNEDKLIEFCRLIQKLSPVDSSVVPYPWNMSGYNDKVIMASGSFVQGSSIELSADGPIREPYICYLQGGLTYEHLKIVAIEFATIYLNK
jgi:cystathionine beta-lyase family protein involved in aluminum resistance